MITAVNFIFMHQIVLPSLSNGINYNTISFEHIHGTIEKEMPLKNRKKCNYIVTAMCLASSLLDCNFYSCRLHLLTQFHH